MANHCRFGRHKWGEPTKDGIRVCNTCKERKYPKPPPKPNSDLKPTRCKLGIHLFKNKVRGKLNRCEDCGSEIYVKTAKDELKHTFYDVKRKFKEGDFDAGQ